MVKEKNLEQQTEIQTFAYYYIDFVNNSNINLIELMTRDKIMYAYNTFICYENNKNVLYLDDIF